MAVGGAGDRGARARAGLPRYSIAVTAPSGQDQIQTAGAVALRVGFEFVLFPLCGYFLLS